ncbi:MAG: riboflavin synthase subunit alpha [Sulfurimonas sp. RIFOXYD12_FULL_33_39]|uniref:riboflavin synthase n=1 Tax=unclassified Sulfurimonas TaxID=2623549 RepID=UPI0008AABA2B|nr:MULTISPECIES: riboflavin synthase [unclassified Sulfurimonas]OHE01461.1 MAG: riboflavin synthase subunit alpha [Sulfurimonas sp. RIFCSPLOWO2_12_FULL_34_6]OHE09806.1 MAG: riboflavin synthase subunit alpha [Sulfurimonas sp. RIFOXYD12_FULL_33_39]OHE13686.1 MAG: riboflavin synthase subunit alpha [Sulfurimonas sp. RIFOXYD2_FULL_34_21]DAB28100.1 MAG TPA: riboflavin synthase [Sulfurimonas sp. UBA10385]
MFTGLIREIAHVKSLAGSTLSIRAKHKAKLGDSIAINGACLTVVKVNSDGFSVELSPESQKVLAMENYKNEVHIEPAMMMGDRFEGHVVQGHVDCIGEIKEIKNSGNSYDVFIHVDKKFIPYIIPKGSITVDGVSLTVNEVFADSFRLTIIPHTMKETLFRNYRKGSHVNIETDMFARYVAHIISHQKASLTWDEVESISAIY